MSLRCCTLFVLASTFSTSIAIASDLEAQKAALDAISSFANDLCKDPPLVGNESKYELSGEAKAELSNVLKKVVDLGIEGAAKYQGASLRAFCRKT